MSYRIIYSLVSHIAHLRLLVLPHAMLDIDQVYEALTSAKSSTCASVKVPTFFQSNAFSKDILAGLKDDSGGKTR